MRYKVLIAGSVVAVVVVVLVVVGRFGSENVRAAAAAARPSDEAVAFAQEASDLLLNELIAALFTEFDETTEANVEHGKLAIGLIFADCNSSIRLVGDSDDFVLLGGDNNEPQDRFERTALRKALDGQSHTDVDLVDGVWFYRRTVPLSPGFHQNCVLCHVDFEGLGLETWVGALMLKVPVPSD